MTTPGAPEPTETSCYNCGASLHGPFCAACGQQVQPLNPRLRDVARQMTFDLLDVDGRTVRSIRQLLLSPGFLTREYFEGRRVSWLPPLRLYVIFSVLYFAISALAPAEGFKVTVRSTEQTQAERDAEVAAALKKIGYNDRAELEEAARLAWARWMPRVMFVLVPLFAVPVQIVRRRDKRTYPQHLFFALHVHAVWFAAFALAATFRLIAPDIVAEVARAIIFIYGFVYLVLALRNAYGGTGRRAFAHAIVIGGVYVCAAGMVTLGVLLPTIFWHW